MEDESTGAHAEQQPRASDVAEATEPLARVRFGLGKELRLYPDTFAIVLAEEAQEVRYNLDAVRRVILQPGDRVPNKLVLMFEMDDGTTDIVTDSMTNPRAFRALIDVLHREHPGIELDPPDMSEQLRQALEIRRMHLIGCYGTVLGLCLVLWIAFLVIAYIGAHAPR